VPGFVDHVIVVDDGSRDATAAIAQRASRRAAGRGGRPIEVIVHPENRGVGAAIATGYARALALGADVTAVMAGDGQMDPADLPGLLAPIVDGTADYAKGNRFAWPGGWRQMPPVRMAGNLVLSWLTRLASGYRQLTDSQCGYTVASRRALLAIGPARMFARYGYPNDLLARWARPGRGSSTFPCVRSAGPVALGTPPDPGRAAHRAAPVRGLRAAAPGAGGTARGRGGAVRIGLLTTSFPCHPGDYAGSFVDRARRLLDEGHTVEVLAAGDGPDVVDGPLPVRRISPGSLFYREGAPEALERGGLAGLAALRLRIGLLSALSSHNRALVNSWAPRSGRALRALPGGNKDPCAPERHAGNTRLSERAGQEAPGSGSGRSGWRSSAS
jgi:hypothetical protein